MTAVLALDISTRCGWAALGADNRVRSGVEHLKPGSHPGQRLLALRRHLVDLHAQIGPFEEVAFEELRFAKYPDAIILYGKFLGVVEAWACANQIPLIGYAPAAIKKHATGNGAAKKPDMIAAVRARGFAPADDNEADAIALLRLHLGQPTQDDLLTPIPPKPTHAQAATGKPF